MAPRSIADPEPFQQTLEQAGLGVQRGELLRGVPAEGLLAREPPPQGLEGFTRAVLVAQRRVRQADVVVGRRHPAAGRASAHDLLEANDRLPRSEERRVGKECRSGRPPGQYKEKWI